MKMIEQVVSHASFVLIIKFKAKLCILKKGLHKDSVNKKAKTKIVNGSLLKARLLAIECWCGASGHHSIHCRLQH